MATEVAPSSVVELTDLGKCLMKHEVGASLIQLGLSCSGQMLSVHCCRFLVFGFCSPELLSIPHTAISTPTPAFALSFSKRNKISPCLAWNSLSSPG